MVRTSYIRYDDNHIRLVLVVDQHAKLDFYSVGKLKPQFAGRHVTLLGHISWFRANQSLIFLLNAACLIEKQQIPIL